MDEIVSLLWQVTLPADHDVSDPKTWPVERPSWDAALADYLPHPPGVLSFMVVHVAAGSPPSPEVVAAMVAEWTGVPASLVTVRQTGRIVIGPDD